MRGCDQRYRRRFTHKRRPAFHVFVIIPLNFALCMHSTHENRKGGTQLKNAGCRPPEAHIFNVIEIFNHYQLPLFTNSRGIGSMLNQAC